MMDNMDTVHQCKLARDSHVAWKTSRLCNVSFDKHDIVDLVKDESPFVEEESIILEGLCMQNELYSCKLALAKRFIRQQTIMSCLVLHIRTL